MKDINCKDSILGSMLLQKYTKLNCGSSFVRIADLESIRSNKNKIPFLVALSKNAMYVFHFDQEDQEGFQRDEEGYHAILRIPLNQIKQVWLPYTSHTNEMGKSIMALRTTKMVLVLDGERSNSETPCLLYLELSFLYNLARGTFLDNLVDCIGLHCQRELIYEHVADSEMMDVIPTFNSVFQQHFPLPVMLDHESLRLLQKEAYFYAIAHQLQDGIQLLEDSNDEKDSLHLFKMISQFVEKSSEYHLVAYSFTLLSLMDYSQGNYNQAIHTLCRSLKLCQQSHFQELEFCNWIYLARMYHDEEEKKSILIQQNSILQDIVSSLSLSLSLSSSSSLSLSSSSSSSLSPSSQVLQETRELNSHPSHQDERNLVLGSSTSFESLYPYCREEEKKSIFLFMKNVILSPKSPFQYMNHLLEYYSSTRNQSKNEYVKTAGFFLWKESFLWTTSYGSNKKIICFDDFEDKKQNDQIEDTKNFLVVENPFITQETTTEQTKEETTTEQSKEDTKYSESKHSDGNYILEKLQMMNISLVNGI